MRRRAKNRTLNLSRGVTLEHVHVMRDATRLSQSIYYASYNFHLCSGSLSVVEYEDKVSMP